MHASILNITFDCADARAQALFREKRGVWVYYRARTSALLSLGTLIGCPAS